jgi:hypothetical protein
MMQRVSFIRIAAAGAALSPLPLAAQTASLKVATLPIDQGAQAYFAADLGMFTRAGMNVDVQSLKWLLPRLPAERCRSDSRTSPRSRSRTSAACRSS